MKSRRISQNVNFLLCCHLSKSGDTYFDIIISSSLWPHTILFLSFLFLLEWKIIDRTSFLDFCYIHWKIKPIKIQFIPNKKHRRNNPLYILLCPIICFLLYIVHGVLFGLVINMLDQIKIFLSHDSLLEDWPKSLSPTHPEWLVVGIIWMDYRI